MTDLTMPHEDEARLKARVGARVFGDAGRWTPVTGGSINAVWRVDRVGHEQLVVRIGPSPATVARGPSWLRGEALACELIVLDRVAPVIPHLPVPRAAGFLPGSVPWVVQTLLPGVPLATVMETMPARDRRNIWRRTGSLLRRMQSVPAPWFGTPDGRYQYHDWSSMVRADATGLLGDARRFGLPAAPFANVLDDIARHADALAQVRTPAVVHSDLDPRHVFVTEAETGWEISGVIDWEYARYADPMSESIIVEMLARPVDDPDRAALLDGLGVPDAALADPAFWQRQRIYRGIMHGWAMTDMVRPEHESLL